MLFLLLLYVKAQNCVTKIRSYELECVIIIVQVTKRVINYRIPFSRYLASGCSFHDLHFSYRIGISTARNIVRTVCPNNWSIVRPERMSKPIKEQYELTALEFERRADFPHCLGAVDGKRIQVIKPEHSGSMFYNNKDFFPLY